MRRNLLHAHGKLAVLALLPCCGVLKSATTATVMLLMRLVWLCVHLMRFTDLPLQYDCMVLMNWMVPKRKAGFALQNPTSQMHFNARLCMNPTLVDLGSLLGGALLSALICTIAIT